MTFPSPLGSRFLPFGRFFDWAISAEIATAFALHTGFALALSFFQMYVAWLFVGLGLLGRISRAQGEEDPEDPLAPRSFVQTQWTAFGDSYSAGVGAGSYSGVPGGGKGGDCRRSTGSFPAQLDDTPDFKTNTSHVFRFLACSGAVVGDVLAEGADSQINQFRAAENKPGNTEYATISIGGNDVGFGAIIKACLYHVSGNCEQEKTNTRAKFQTIAQDLVRTYTAIIKGASDSGNGQRRFLLHVVGK